MKLYTGKGDRGITSLWGGKRVSKDHERVHAYGDVDELNAHLGVLKAALPPQCLELTEELNTIQQDLFVLGGWLATPPQAELPTAVPQLTEVNVRRIESWIDEKQACLPMLKGFILPEGHMAAALAHMARTVCRRAERRAVRLLTESSSFRETDEEGEILPLIYMNRLSDYLFVVARYCNALTQTVERLWKPD